MDRLPAVPPDAEPVDMMREPVEPLVLEPLPTATAPLEPLLPLPLPRDTAPLLPEAAEPLSSTSRPDPVAESPLASTTLPEAPVELTPVARLRLPLGPWVLAARHVPDPDSLEVVVQIDGREAQRYSTAGMQRGVARLIAEVSAFMTLTAGDLLMLGAGPAAPLARAGQTVRITIEPIAYTSSSR